MLRLATVLAGALILVATTGGCGSSSRRTPSAAGAVRAALRAALPAFARPGRPVDLWPGDPARFGTITSSREIASLPRPPYPPLRLYLVATATQGTCLYIAGSGGNCNTAPNFFGPGKVEVLNFGSEIAGVVAPDVASVHLRTATGTISIPLTADNGFLFACPRTGTQSSCAGDLIGIDRRGRRSFVSKL